MAIRISGLASGLDTESLVSELVSAYRTKTDKYKKAQTKLTWKQDAWKSLNTKVNSLYSAISSMRFSSAYTMKKATVSDATKATVTANSSAVIGTQTLKVKTLAKAGYLTGGKLGDDVTSSSKLSDLGITSDGAVSVTVDGKTTDINVSSSMTVSEFVDELKNAGVNASFDAGNKRIFVSAKESGKEKDFSLTGNDANGLSALSKLGLLVESEADTKYYSELKGLYDTAGGTEAGLETYLNNTLTQMADSEALITNNKAEKKYAEAYAATKEYTDNLTSEELEEMYSLINEDKPEKVFFDKDGNKVQMTKEVNTTDADGNHTYYYKLTKEDGTKEDVSEDEFKSQGYYSAQDKIEEYAIKAGLTKEETEKITDDDGNEVETTKTVVDSSALSTFKTNLTTVKEYEAEDTNAEAIAEVKSAYEAGTIDELKNDLDEEISESEKYLKDNAILDGYTTSDVDALKNKIMTAAALTDGSLEYSTTATRINGSNATIVLNGAEYESSSNTFSVNGLDITATGLTGDDEITITTDTNVDGLYDKIKTILKQYNEVINEMNKLYNADSAKGYEPLTTEEKDAMTDTQVEEWEKKIKDAILRKDGNLGTLITSMTSSMAKSYTVNGTTYSLSSFGIKTTGYLGSSNGNQYEYHIDGDADDISTSGNTDKLRTAIANDSEGVQSYFQQLMQGLYTELGSKMKSSSVRSALTIYNDKEMAKEYSEYSTTISKWEDKVTAIEDSYYKKFSAMEKALSELQSKQQSMSSLLGS